MPDLFKHIDAMFAVDSTTMTILVLFCGSAIWFIRNHLANIVTLVMLFPLALLVSLVCNYILSVLGVFNPMKLGDWLVVTILAGTFGTMFAISTAAACAHMWDKAPAR